MISKIIFRIIKVFIIIILLFNLSLFKKHSTNEYTFVDNDLYKLNILIGYL